MANTSYNYRKPTATETALQRYYRLKNEQRYKQEPVAQPVQPKQEPAKEEKNKGGFWGGLGYSLEKLGLQFVRGLEGIGDYIVAGGAELFGQDEYAEKVMKDDWMNYNHADEWFNPSNGWKIAGDITGAVGGMLPSIGAAAGITLATGGAGAGAGAGLLANAVGTGMFMTSAAGQSVSEAAKESGSLSGKEWLYGSLSGAAEGAVEAVSGGIGGTAAGTVLGKQLAKSTVGKLATTFVGEGIEEVASDLIDPALRRITGVDKNATVDWEQLPRTFLVGGAAGGIMGGLGRAVNAARAGGFNNLNAAERAQTLTEERAALNKQALQGKETNRTAAEIEDVKQRLSKTLQKMDEPTREQFLQKHGHLAGYFNADGSMRTEETTVADTAAVSPALRGQALKHEPTVQPLKPTVQAALDDAVRLSDGKVNYVVTDDLSADVNGYYDNETGTMYINSTVNEADVPRVVISHEITHSLEGTKEYARFADYALKQMEDDARYADGKYRADYAQTHKDASPETLDYIVATERVADYVANELLGNEQSVRKLVQNNESLARRVYNWIKDKLAVLTKRGADRETARELNRALKLYESALRHSVGGLSLDNVQAAYDAQKDADDKAAERGIKGVSMAKPAVEGARYRLEKYTETEERNFSGGKIVIYKDEKTFEQFVKHALSDSGFSKRLLFGKVSKNISDYVFSKYGLDIAGFNVTLDGDSVRHIDKKHKGIIQYYQQVLSEPDNITLSDRSKVGKPILVFEKTLDNGKYQAVEVVSDGKKSLLCTTFYKVTKKDMSADSGSAKTLTHTSETPIGTTYLSTTSISQKEDLSTPETKKDKNIRYSLSKDSQGRQLTEEQAEFFKDSKVRDKNGNLLVVYHGTGEKFTVFDITKSRSWDERLNYDLPGFYFSESTEESGSYGDNLQSYYVNVTKPYDGNTYTLAKEKGSFRKAYDYLVSQGYDGIIDTEMGDGYTEIIAFKPEQIKLTTNKTPTTNPDIRYSLAKDGKKGYTGTETEVTADGRERTTGIGWNQFRRNFNAADDSERISIIREIRRGKISKGESAESVVKFVDRIVEKTRLAAWNEQSIVKTASSAGYEVIFCKPKNAQRDYIIYGDALFLPDTITTDRAGEILDELKPYRKADGERRAAHISEARWADVKANHPDAYVTTMRIQDFLDLTADRLAQRDIHGETAALDESRITNVGDELYLKIDFTKKQVLDHEGRHRLTALRNAGYTHADVFVYPVGQNRGEVIGRIDVMSQEDGRTVPLAGLIRAFNTDYDSYIRSKYRTDTDGNIRYSLSKPFAQQVDDVLAGKHAANLDLYVSETPSAFVKLGFPKTPMLMRNSKIKEILDKHSEMSADIIKRIPEAIQNPLLILKSKTSPNESVVAITEVMTDKGEMIVPVWVNQDGVYLDVTLDKPIAGKTNFVASTYGRNVKGLLEYALQNDGILYANEDMKKVSELLTRHGLQLPAPLKIADFTISISQDTAKVNRSDVRYSMPKPKAATEASLPTEKATAVLKEVPRTEPTKKEKALDLWTNFQIHFSDE